MALQLVRKGGMFSADVEQIIEAFTQCEHHVAFIRKYGRGVDCHIFHGMGHQVGGRTIPKLRPGFERIIWTVEVDQLKPGMEIIFQQSNQQYVGCVVKDIVEDAFTYVREGVETFVSLHEDDVALYLFIECPGPYMRLVGQDNYKGDLTDLRPLRAGEVMSDLERQIREFYEEMQESSECEDHED